MEPATWMSRPWPHRPDQTERPW